MSFIAHENKIIEDDVNSVVHTSTFGTITETKSIDNLFHRSILENYQFTTDFAGSVDDLITVTMSEDKTVSVVSVLGVAGYLLDIEMELQDNSSSTVYTAITDDLTTRTRSIDGEDYTDYVWDFSELTNVRKILVRFTLPAFVNKGFIGNIQAFDKQELDIKPSTLKYSFGTQGSKVRTEGSQINANKNNSYMIAGFTTAATKESLIVSGFHNINYVSSVSEPLILIPQKGESIILYGTQQKPNSTIVKEAQVDHEWVHETTFLIEEEF